MKMTNGPCCPGKTTTKRITVGGQQIGIAQLDQIIEKALSSEGVSDAELKMTLLRELKIFNYVPPSVEGEYLDGIWDEFQKERARRRKRG
jgi:hypothetical protein